MRGYRVVYSELDGTIKETFFGEPMTNISTYRVSNIDIVKQIFSIVYPDCEIILIERCNCKEGLTM
jgi:hypothetical protein